MLFRSLSSADHRIQNRRNSCASDLRLGEGQGSCDRHVNKITTQVSIFHLILLSSTSSKESRLEEYLAVGDLREFSYHMSYPTLLAKPLSLYLPADLTEAEIAAIDEAGAKGPPTRR